MRVVADTNIVVSGLLWKGNSRGVLDAARADAIELFTSPVLLTELEDVLNREKFAQRLALVGVSARELVLGYAALASVIQPDNIEPVVLADPDDDAVLACAVAAQAEIVVSGDKSLAEIESVSRRSYSHGSGIGHESLWPDVGLEMKKTSVNENGDDLRAEYDLSKLKGGVRGKYYQGSKDSPPEPVHFPPKGVSPPDEIILSTRREYLSEDFQTDNDVQELIELMFDDPDECCKRMRLLKRP